MMPAMNELEWNGRKTACNVMQLGIPSRSVQRLRAHRRLKENVLRRASGKANKQQKGKEKEGTDERPEEIKRAERKREEGKRR